MDGSAGRIDGGLVAADAAVRGDGAATPDAALALDAGAVGGTDAGSVRDRSMCTASPDATGTTMRTVTARGTTMRYLTHVPPSYDPSVPSSIVLALHGAGDMASNYLAAVWASNADELGFVLVVPDGSCPLGPGNTWCMDDPNMVLAALDDTERCYSIDIRRRIMHGFSAGGILAYFIGLEAADAFAGISISAADLGSAEAYAGRALLPAAWLVPVSHFHGTTDMNFPISYARTGRDRLEAAGHTVYFHEFAGGHTTSAAFARTMYMDLASSRSPAGGP